VTYAEDHKSKVQLVDSSASDTTSRYQSGNSQLRDPIPILKQSASFQQQTFNASNKSSNKGLEDTYKFRSISHQNTLNGSPIKSTVSAEKRYLRDNSVEVQKVREAIEKLELSKRKT
jgi:hypothetical protein